MYVRAAGGRSVYWYIGFVAYVYASTPSPDRTRVAVPGAWAELMWGHVWVSEYICMSWGFLPWVSVPPCHRLQCLFFHIEQACT